MADNSNSGSYAAQGTMSKGFISNAQINQASNSDDQSRIDAHVAETQANHSGAFMAQGTMSKGFTKTNGK